MFIEVIILFEYMPIFLWRYPQTKQVMYKANFGKYTQNDTLMTVLVDTGEKYLIEASHHDLFWGAGVSLKNKHCLMPDQHDGLNHMGKLLAMIRQILRLVITRLHTSDSPTDTVILHNLKNSPETILTSHGVAVQS